MPKERDPARLHLLRRLFAERATEFVEFKKKADTGGERSDWGLKALLGSEQTKESRFAILKAAIVEYLDQGLLPTREDVAGDLEMEQDPALFYHFWPVIKGRKLFVKVELVDADSPDPICRVLSVKPGD